MSVYASEPSKQGSVYAQKGTSGGSAYAQNASATVSTEPKKKHSSFWHKVAKYSGAEIESHLLKDVGEAAVGVGPGLYRIHQALAKADPSNPRHFGHGDTSDLKSLGKGLLHQYKDYYGHNVFGHIYQHPLQPILDAGTVATGGVGAAAKLGKVAADVGAISDTSKLAKLGERGTVTTRSPRAIATGKGPVHTELTSAKPAVKLREQAAAAVRANHPEGVLRVGGELKHYGKQIEQRAQQHAMANLTPHQVYAKATRKLTPDEWTALHIRAMDVHPEDLAHLWHDTPLAATARDPKIMRLVEQPSKRMVQAEPAARLLSEQGAGLYRQTGRLTDETAAARPDLTKRQVSELLGRPAREVTGQPYYFPHTREPARSVSPLVSSGGGKGVPRAPGSAKQNLGVLSLQGKLHLRGDVLGPDFLRRVKYVKYDEIHKGLVRGAVRVSRQEIEQLGGKLPKGWEYVRARAGQRIPPGIRGEGEHPAPIEQIVPNPADLSDSQLAKDGFATSDPAQAHISGEHYYIVPKTTVKAATGEFTRSSDFTRNFVKRPLMVWRAAVLGLRVGFLTNNLVGNSILYAAKTGGNGALRDLFGAIMESHGSKVAYDALKDPATPPELRLDLYREYFPEQVQGTFGRTQSPATSSLHLAGQRATEAGRAVTGAIPRVTSKVAEELPRRALVRNAIRRSPEFRKAYNDLPRQTRSFENAARQLLEGKGGAAYQRRISKEVSQALGDYLHMSPTERNIIRNTLPFYAWYRAITTTTYHLAVDTPLRANLLSQIGRIGKEWSDEQLGHIPTFLWGAIPLGHGANGTTKVLGTQGLNPYATLEQLRRGATEDVTDLGLNPFLIAAAQAYAGADNGISPGALAGQSLLAMLRGLPPSRLVAPMPPSKLYPNRSRKSELYSFLGAPIKEYNPGVAAQQAAQGR